MPGVRTNLWKLYAYKFISEFYLIVPVLIPYYVSHGLNSTQVFTIQAAYALAVLLLEVPSGYLADVIGRRATLILGAAFMPLGLAVYAFSDRFLAFVLAEFFLAVANSMRSGCESALIYDTLLELREAEHYKKYEGRAILFTRVGTATSAVLGGIAALAFLRLPFLINIATSTLMLPLALSLAEPQRSKRRARNPFLDILKITRFSLAHGEIRHLIFYAALIGSAGIIAVWASFLYYESLGISVGLFGLIFAAFQLSSAFGSSRAHAIEKAIGMRKALTLPVFIGAIFVLAGLVRSPAVIPFIILYSFLWGLSFPLFLDLINRRIESDIRATVLSVAMMAGSLVYVVLAPLFGRLADASSLGKAFLVLGVFFLAGMTLVLVSLSRRYPGVFDTKVNNRRTAEDNAAAPTAS
jgi:predicted MFS family arabinose efflux permease